MNTDAPNVEDIHILHIKERLSMSCIASFEDRSNIFHNRPFTLCKNDLDFSAKFDSVAVSESISSSSTINLSCAVWTNRVVVHKQVSLFLLPSIHEIYIVEKTNSCQYSTLSDLMSKRLKVSLFFDAAHSMSSGVVDFHVCHRAFWCSGRD